MRDVFRRRWPAPVFAVAAALLTPGAASAHALTILCRQADGGVEVRVGFGRTAATPAPAAGVRVTDPAGRVVAEGVTDAAGVWRMPTPPAGEYRVEADAEDHTAAVRLTIGPPTGEAPAGGVSTAPVARDRPPVWPAAAVFAVVAVIVGVWWFRGRRPGTAPSPPAEAS